MGKVVGSLVPPTHVLYYMHLCSTIVSHCAGITGRGLVSLEASVTSPYKPLWFLPQPGRHFTSKQNASFQNLCWLTGLLIHEVSRLSTSSSEWYNAIQKRGHAREYYSDQAGAIRHATFSCNSNWVSQWGPRAVFMILHATNPC